MRTAWLALAALAVSCLAPRVLAQQAEDRAHLAPTEYRSHFEPNSGAAPQSGSRDGWESYPLVEDAGYDPTLQVDTTAGRSSLARTAAPTRDGTLRLGFVRRLHLLAGPGATFHAQMRVPHLAGAATVRISVFRGEQEESHEVTLHGADWQDVDCPLNASNAWITAVAADVSFPGADHNRPEQVLLADVRIKALAPGRLLLSSPQALWDPSRAIYYAQRSVLAGETFTARIDAATKVRWRLLGPDNKQRGEGSGPEAKHAFLPTDPAGIWTLHFEGDHASATVLVLVQNPKAGLLFDHPPAISADLLASLRQRQQALRKLTHVDAGLNIARMNPDFLLPGLSSYFAIVQQPAELAMLDAILFRVTGDRDALHEATDLLHGISRWPLWVHPWFPAHGYHSYYPVGIMARFVVMSEEFLGADLPPSDRRTLDAALMDQVVKPIYEEYVLEDRLQFGQSNWIGNTVGGALLAAVANNDRMAAGYTLGLFAKDHDHLRAAYTPDGSYGEGISYQRFDLETTALIAELAKRKLGTSIDGLLANGERYMRYAAYADGAVLDYGDSHVDLRPSNVFAYLAAQNDAPLLSAFYLKYLDTGTSQLLSRVLWGDMVKAPPSSVPPGPASALFPDRGIAVLRDGWQAGSTVAAMRAGMNFNHNHADQGSLFYAAGGTLWLGEAGYADYYKDPSYPLFNTQALGHNVLLLDDNPESQMLPGNAQMGSYPKFTHALIADGASLLEADLTSAYGRSVSRYTRSLFGAPGGLLFVVDHIITSQPHTFQQLWHPKAAITSLEAARGRWQMTAQGTNVAVQSFSTQPLSLSEHLDPMPLAAYDRAENAPVDRPRRIVVSTPNASTDLTIATVIAPTTGPTEAAWSEEGSSLVLSAGGVTLRIPKATGPNAPALLLHSNDAVMVLGGTRLEGIQGEHSITADHPVDMAARRQASGELELEVNSPSATTITLHGLEIAQTSATAKEHAVSLQASPGRTLIKLRIR